MDTGLATARQAHALVTRDTLARTVRSAYVRILQTTNGVRVWSAMARVPAVEHLARVDAIIVDTGVKHAKNFIVLAIHLTFQMGFARSTQKRRMTQMGTEPGRMSVVGHHKGTVMYRLASVYARPVSMESIAHSGELEMEQ